MKHSSRYCVFNDKVLFTKVMDEQLWAEFLSVTLCVSLIKKTLLENILDEEEYIYPEIKQKKQWMVFLVFLISVKDMKWFSTYQTLLGFCARKGEKNTITHRFQSSHFRRERQRWLQCIKINVFLRRGGEGRRKRGIPDKNKR